MKNAVALNGRFSGTPQPTGTQTAAFGLFDAIVRSPDRAISLVVFADPNFPGVNEWTAFQSVRLVPVPLQRWSRGRAQIWEQIQLPHLCKKWNCTVAHHPINTSPARNLGVKQVVTLHDLNFYNHPEWYTRSFRLVYAVTAVAGLRKADRVVAISDYVRDHAEKDLGIAPDRLRRIYNGVKFTAVEASSARTDVPYLLCVGSLQPHKNLPRLIKAFVQVKAAIPSLELWVVGRPQPSFSEMPELHALLQTPGVKVLGYLSDAGLRVAYANALVFCYPSLEEGFGLPMLEAMIAGAPVLTSNCSCLPEIAGPAAELINPFSEDAIARGVRKIVDLTPDQRAQWIRRGRSWATKFSWSSAAREYLHIYANLL
jgi:glycosyltransferase involved in cell wall biosynthesis